jgi:predicted DNA-binding transcriptional regulator AlpA
MKMLNTSPLETKASMEGKRLLSVEETAVYLSLSPRTIYNGIAPKSKIPFPIKPKRWGKRVLFDIKDIDRYVDSLDSISNG